MNAAADNMSLERLESLPRRALQKLAKSHGIKANLKSSVIVERLAAVLCAPPDVEDEADKENQVPSDARLSEKDGATRIEPVSGSKAATRVTHKSSPRQEKRSGADVEIDHVMDSTTNSHAGATETREEEEDDEVAAASAAALTHEDAEMADVNADADGDIADLAAENPCAVHETGAAARGLQEEDAANSVDQRFESPEEGVKVLQARETYKKLKRDASRVRTMYERLRAREVPAKQFRAVYDQYLQECKALERDQEEFVAMAQELGIDVKQLELSEHEEEESLSEQMEKEAAVPTQELPPVPEENNEEVVPVKKAKSEEEEEEEEEEGHQGEFQPDDLLAEAKPQQGDQTLKDAPSSEKDVNAQDTADTGAPDLFSSTQESTDLCQLNTFHVEFRQSLTNSERLASLGSEGLLSSATPDRPAIPSTEESSPASNGSTTSGETSPQEHKAADWKRQSMASSSSGSTDLSVAATEVISSPANSRSPPDLSDVGVSYPDIANSSSASSSASSDLTTSGASSASSSASARSSVASSSALSGVVSGQESAAVPDSMDVGPGTTLISSASEVGVEKPEDEELVHVEYDKQVETDVQDVPVEDVEMTDNQKTELALVTKDCEEISKVRPVDEEPTAENKVVDSKRGKQETEEAFAEQEMQEQGRDHQKRALNLAAVTEKTKCILVAESMVNQLHMQLFTPGKHKLSPEARQHLEVQYQTKSEDLRRLKKEYDSMVHKMSSVSVSAPEPLSPQSKSESQCQPENAANNAPRPDADDECAPEVLVQGPAEDRAIGVVSSGVEMDVADTERDGHTNGDADGDVEMNDNASASQEPVIVVNDVHDDSRSAEVSDLLADGKPAHSISLEEDILSAVQSGEAEDVRAGEEEEEEEEPAVEPKHEQKSEEYSKEFINEKWPEWVKERLKQKIQEEAPDHAEARKQEIEEYIDAIGAKKPKAKPVGKDWEAIHAKEARKHESIEEYQRRKEKRMQRLLTPTVRSRTAAKAKKQPTHISQTAKKPRWNARSRSSTRPNPNPSLQQLEPKSHPESSAAAEKRKRRRSSSAKPATRTKRRTSVVIGGASGHKSEESERPVRKKRLSNLAFDPSKVKSRVSAYMRPPNTASKARPSAKTSTSKAAAKVPPPGSRRKDWSNVKPRVNTGRTQRKVSPKEGAAKKAPKRGFSSMQSAPRDEQRKRRRTRDSQAQPEPNPQ